MQAKDVKIVDTPDVQNFLKLVSGLDQDGGNPRVKQIMHRMMSDLYKMIEDLEITSDEYWTAVAYLNTLGQNHEAGLLSPGLGLDHFLDMRMDAVDDALGIDNPTPRTIEGPLYVAGAPEATGYARMDDGTDPNGHPLILHGTVYDENGKPMPNAKVEIWHANTKGFYSHFDPTGEQAPFNMRRTIFTDANGEYKARTIIPSGYGCPPEGPTQQLLNQLGRHGNRPAHIHYFVSADGHRKLTTQINVAGDPYTYDDFAYATRDGLVVEAVEHNDPDSMKKFDIDVPFAEMTFDLHLTPLVNGEDNQVVDRPRLQA